MSIQQDHHVQFFTAVCKDWLPLLGDDHVKRLIIEALAFRTRKGALKICCYVIMPNHIHLIWRINKNYKREDVQRDFLKFTAKQILLYLKSHDADLYARTEVQAADRSHQVWKRDSMSVDLYSEKFFQQKLAYIHANPCQPKWNLAAYPSAYLFSSAAFYEETKDAFQFLTHYTEI